MPLTRGDAVGYDAELMAFKFTMRNGERVVQCQISHAALSDLACRGGRAAARDLQAEFEAHRDAIEAIASAQFDQTLPAQPVDATQALNLSAGVSNCKVSRGRSFS
jgi:hypothetical protein